MKVTLNWLRQYVDFNGSPEELAERLTMLGLEVEGVQKLGGEFEGIVVAQVITRDKHPNADKLSLCRVNDGRGERQIVCGAQNFKAGDKVPLDFARPDAARQTRPAAAHHQSRQDSRRRIPGHALFAGRIGLARQGGGPAHSARGRHRRPAFCRISWAGPRGDVVYDLEITPNRPDWNSVIGIARELSALTGNSLRLPEVNIPSAKLASEPTENLFACASSSRNFARATPPASCAASKSGPARIGCARPWKRPACAASTTSSMSPITSCSKPAIRCMHLIFVCSHAAPAAVPTVVVRRAAREGKNLSRLTARNKRSPTKCS